MVQNGDEPHSPAAEVTVLVLIVLELTAHGPFEDQSHARPRHAMINSRH